MGPGIHLGLRGYRKRSDIWTPLQLAPVLWVRADAADLSLATADVTGAADISGSSHPLTSTGSGHPTYAASDANFGGRGSITVPTGKVLSASLGAPLTTASAWTIVASLRWHAVGGARYAIDVGDFAANGYGITRSGVDERVTAFAVDHFISPTAADTVTRTISARPPAGITWTSVAGTPRMRIDGVVKALSGSNTCNNPNSTFVIGSAGADTFSFRHVLVFNTALSDANVTLVENYIAAN